MRPWHQSPGAAVMRHHIAVNEKCVPKRLRSGKKNNAEKWRTVRNVALPQVCEMQWPVPNNEVMSISDENTVRDSVVVERASNTCFVSYC